MSLNHLKNELQLLLILGQMASAEFLNKRKTSLSMIIDHTKRSHFLLCLLKIRQLTPVGYIVLQ